MNRYILFDQENMVESITYNIDKNILCAFKILNLNNIKILLYDRVFDYIDGKIKDLLDENGIEYLQVQKTIDQSYSGVYKHYYFEQVEHERKIIWMKILDDMYKELENV